MKIFFISPDERKLWNTAGDRAPLGVGYLSSYCRKILNVDTQIFDLNHDSEDSFFDEIRKQNPDFICVSVTTPSYLECLRLVKEIKNLGFNGKIIAGGNHITDNPYEELTGKNYDYIVVGDGESALKKIIQNETDSKVVISEKADVDSVPWPDYEGLRFERYWMTLEGKKCAMIIGSRGCIYSCAFCGSAKIKKWRPRNPSDIVNEMKFLMDNYGIEAFYFGDDIFSFDRNRVFEICRLIKQNLKPVKLRIQTRVNLVDPEMLQKLKATGVDVISLGLESGDDQILRNIQKGATVDQARKAVKMIHDAGIKVKGFFIIGLPGDTRESVMRTIEFAKEINADYVDFYLYTPYASTPIWNNPEKYGMEIIKPVDSNWNEYYQVNPKDFSPKVWKVKHNNLSEDEARELMELAKKTIMRLGQTI
ncbi:MAG TPA: radical SAM protein [Candidatus Nanoarchaeia archaeon]|nr:radical SAM protein [Candidatus Nanoarchaeia archaeon]